MYEEFGERLHWSNDPHIKTLSANVLLNLIRTHLRRELNRMMLKSRAANAEKKVDAEQLISKPELRALQVSERASE